VQAAVGLHVDVLEDLRHRRRALLLAKRQRRVAAEA
jgi:hypothetical protein